MFNATLHAVASKSVSKDPIATGWFFICGGISEMVLGPLLWRNYRGIASKPYRGLGFRGQRRLGVALTCAGPLTIALGVLSLIGRFLRSNPSRDVMTEGRADHGSASSCHAPSGARTPRDLLQLSGSRVRPELRELAGQFGVAS